MSQFTCLFFSDFAIKLNFTELIVLQLNFNIILLNSSYLSNPNQLGNQSVDKTMWSDEKILVPSLLPFSVEEKEGSKINHKIIPQILIKYAKNLVFSFLGLHLITFLP